VENRQVRWVPVEDTSERSRRASEPEAFTPQWFLFQFLREWTPEDLEVAIKKDVQVDLSFLGDYIIDAIANEVVKWFREYRPDLYKVLSTDEGISWLKRNIKRILRRD